MRLLTARQEKRPGDLRTKTRIEEKGEGATLLRGLPKKPPCPVEQKK